MSLQDIVPVLQGFSSAYGKLAATDDPSSTHRLKISAVRPGSADIILEVWTTLGQNAAQLTAIGAIAAVLGVAYKIIQKIIGVSKIKRHVKRRPFKESIKANNSIVIANSENVTLEVPLEVYELFKSGSIDKDLDRLTSPLVEGRIDAAEVEARPTDGEVLRERITAEERPYFESDESCCYHIDKGNMAGCPTQFPDQEHEQWVVCTSPMELERSTDTSGNNPAGALRDLRDVRWPGSTFAARRTWIIT